MSRSKKLPLRWALTLGIALLALITAGQASAAEPTPAPPQHVDPRIAQAAGQIQQAAQLIQQTRYADAQAAAQQAIALIEATLGKDVPQLAEPLSLLGDAVRMLGDVAGGEELQRRALALYEKAGAQESGYYAQVLYRLADVLRMRAKFAEALAAQERLAGLYQKLYGPSTAALAVCLSAQAELQRLLGRAHQALPLHDRAIAMAQATQGKQHAYTASLMQAKATTWAALGEYPRAVAGFTEALEIMEIALGPEHMWVGQVANNLGLELVHVGELARAEQLFARALAIDQKTLGPTHPFVAAVLANQGDVALARGRLDDAEAKLRDAYTIAVQAYGQDHPEVIAIAEHFARMLRHSGRPRQALQLGSETLQAREKLHGADHPDLSGSLMLLAELALDRGDVNAGEKLAARAQRLVEKAYGPKHIAAVSVIDLLARIDAVVDNRPQLLARRRAALELHLASNGAGHPNTASAQTNLAEALLPGDVTEAVALMRLALATNVRIFGADHARTAKAHGNLGAALAGLDDLSEARRELSLALEMDRKLHGAESADLAADLYNLGMLHAKQGDLAAAEQQLRASLAMTERLMGAEAPEGLSAAWRLADVLELRGQFAEALKLRARVTALRDAELPRLLWSGDEQRKVDFLRVLAQESAANLHHALRLQPGHRGAAELALQTVLRRHARAVDVLTDTLELLRRRLNPADLPAVEALADSRSRLAAFALRGPGQGDEQFWKSRVAELRTEVAGREQQLSQLSAVYRDRPSEEATVAAVQAVLAPATALIEYAVWTPQSQFSHGRWHERDLPPRLAACVLRHSGPPQWFDLGELEELQDLVVAARRRLNQPEADAAPALEQLSARILQPLRRSLEGVQRLRVAADGPLLLVPFAALPLEASQTVADQMVVSYVGSGRELLSPALRPQPRQPPLVLAHADFGPQTKGHSERAAELTSLAVQPLPGTAAEAQELARLFPKAKVLTGAAALESALTSAKGPQFLHIATHGYFLSARMAPGLAAVKAPLVRSGLLLAGFNRHRPGKDDGVLTALEAASLDLQGTQLAVLSACNTGVGELRAGDGVQGLRRALAMAGAQTVVMSLWSVDDRATQALMVEFYRQWQAGQDRAKALHLAQAHVRAQERWRHPFYWAGFVAAGAE
jgi:CHAT domain-containing protein